MLLDALGTLVELEAPFARLGEELAARGAPVAPEAVRRALRAEMAYYRTHHQVAADRERLAGLRERCADVLRAALPPPAGELPPGVLLEALLAALRFRPFPDVVGVLHALRARGCALVVVSNWDVSLHDVLDATGLRPLVDAVLTSAEEGTAKPEPALFARALALVGVPAGRALHVGDSVEHDVAGALAAGVRPVLVARNGAPAGLAAGVTVIEALDELVPLAAAMATREGGPYPP